MSAEELGFDHGGLVNTPFVPWPRSALDAPAFARFAAFAHSQPEHPAIIDAERIWSYGELHRLALQMAALIGPDGADPVAVLLPMGARLAAAFLGALAAGRPYVPLDPAFPPERNRLILSQAGASCVITDPAGQDLMAWVPDVPPLINVHALDGQPHAAGSLAGCADSMAYIIYTSGSTGQPKGVCQDQRGLLHDVFQYSHAIHLHPSDRLSWLYSPSVNGAIRDIYAALFNGATLVAINIHEVGLRGLGQRVAQTGITVFHAIPPLLRAFLQSGPSPQCLASVRMAYVAGDRFFSSDVAIFYQHFPRNCLIYNGIGSTECATLYRHWFLDRDFVLDSAVVPAGYPIAERESRLLDAHGKEVARGEVGEVQVSSAFVARGYWRHPELSRQAFKPDPRRPGWRQFLTGDLARERPDGLLEFVGRKDAQVKIRGHRVEPGAVEAQLRQLPEVEDAAVVLTGSPESPELSAWLCGRQMTQAALRALLKDRLPAALIPTHFYWVAHIPRLPNFKTDLASLKQPLPELCFAEESIPPALRAQPGTDAPADACTQSMHDKLAVCWNEALSRKGAIELKVPFADQGGDSLAAMSLLVLLEKALTRALDVALVHGQQTFDGLLQALMSPETPKTTLYVVIRPGAVGFPAIAEFSASLPQHIQLQIVPLPLPLHYDEAVSPHFIQKMGTQVAVHICSHQHDASPVHLMGLSFGARIAFEAACQLAAQGVSVGGLIAGDMGPAFYRKTWLARLQDRGRQISRIVTRQEQPNLQNKVLTLLRMLGLLGLLRLWLPALNQKLLNAKRRSSRSKNVEDQKDLPFDSIIIRKARNWQPGYFPGTLTVLVAQKSAVSDGAPHDLGWGPYADVVNCIPVPCGHTELLGRVTQEAVIKHILAAMEQSPVLNFKRFLFGAK